MGRTGPHLIFFMFNDKMTGNPPEKGGDEYED